MGSGVDKGAGNGCTVVGHGGTVGMDGGVGIGDKIGMGGGISMSRRVDMTTAGISACTRTEDEKCRVRLRRLSR